MSDSNNDHNQFAVMDFINDTIIADTHAPRRPAFELLDVRRSGVRFELTQPRKSTGFHFVRQPIQFLLNRFRQDDAIPHFRFRVRAARYSARVTNWPAAISAAVLARAASYAWM